MQIIPNIVTHEYKISMHCWCKNEGNLNFSRFQKQQQKGDLFYGIAWGQINSTHCLPMIWYRKIYQNKNPTLEETTSKVKILQLKLYERISV